MHNQKVILSQQYFSLHILNTKSRRYESLYDWIKWLWTLITLQILSFTSASERKFMCHDKKTLYIEIDPLVIDAYNSIQRNVFKPHENEIHLQHFILFLISLYRNSTMNSHNNDIPNRNCYFVGQNLEWYNPKSIESEEIKYLLCMERSNTWWFLYAPTLYEEQKHFQLAF